MLTDLPFYQQQILGEGTFSCNYLQCFLPSLKSKKCFEILSHDLIFSELSLEWRKDTKVMELWLVFLKVSFLGHPVEVKCNFRVVQKEALHVYTPTECPIENESILLGNIESFFFGTQGIN